MQIQRIRTLTLENPNGVYLPYWTFDSLIGCPVNGTWTLKIQDNVDFNNGTLFGWGMAMSPTSSIASLQADENSIQVFPNPIESSTLMVVEPELVNKNYAVINQTGTIVMNGTISSVHTTLDLSNIESGIYFLRLEENEQMVRIVKL